MSMRRTKIVCTIGPASQTKTTIDKMVRAGLDVARLNFSHGTQAEHRQLIKLLRAAGSRLHQPLAIMQDLQGPRIRIGLVDKKGIELNRQDIVLLVDENKVGQNVFAEALRREYKVLPVQFPLLYKFTKKNSHILINDGLIDLQVWQIKDRVIYCRVKKSGIVFSHKGINLPGFSIKGPVITDKDKEDLLFGLRQKIDFVALSFVHSAQDIKDLRRLLPPKSGIKIVAKIETKEAIRNFDQILDQADAIMVARGDLGIELPIDQVPLLQKKMIKKCLQAAKPVIVATQMLDSMIINSRPTRAEVSDVANAVIDHADALMLSGETAYGRYPVASVRMMKQIIRETEESIFDNLPRDYFDFKKFTVPATVASSVERLVKENKAKVVIVNSLSGQAARLISRHRPEAVIAVLTNSPQTYQQLALSWGVRPYLISSCRSLDSLIKDSLRLVQRVKIARSGDRVIIYSGQPLAKEGLTLVKVQTI